MITIAELIACGIAPSQARLFVTPLQQAMERWCVNTRARKAAFIAQTSHESAAFTRTEENLYYSRPERIRQMWPKRVASLQDAQTLTKNPQALANRVYANRLGNGDESSGEGWKFRGRGLIQLTGRTNYKLAADVIGAPYLSAPNLVALPADACMTAGWYWMTTGCNEMADASLIDQITKAINGPAMVAADERRSLFDDAMQALN